MENQVFNSVTPQLIVGVMGYPKSGKTTYAKKLQLELEAEGKITELFHTDSYLDRLSYQEIPGRILVDINRSSADIIIVEGVGVSRLLKRGWIPTKLIYIQGKRSNGAGISGLCTQIDIAMNEYAKKHIVEIYIYIREKESNQ